MTPSRGEIYRHFEEDWLYIYCLPPGNKGLYVNIMTGSVWSITPTPETTPVPADLVLLAPSMKAWLGME